VEPPSAAELEGVLDRIAARIGERLERQGLITRDCENTYLAFDPAESGGPLQDLIGHSITYRIATGPRQGQKVLTLKTLPAHDERPDEDRLARAHGFSLHAGVGVAGAERTRLEHLVRYVARPALALERLALTPSGNVRYTLKRPYRDGTAQMLFEPFDFMSRLAALVPLPRIHLVRYHGVFASASTLRAAVTPAGRGRGARSERDAKPPSAPKHVSLTWMQRLKRVFGIEIERCRRCGGALKVIASIEEPGVIERILAHRQSTTEEGVAAFTARAPPQPPLL
jgi:hypothetical protein